MTGNNGLKPSCWGPTAWHFLHSVAMGYPESLSNSTEDKIIKDNYKKFYESLEHILPCDWCKIHYTENLKSLPISDYLDSRRNLSLWVYKLHNLVNEATHVSEKNIPSFESVYEMYNSYRVPCDEDSKTCGGDVESGCKIVVQDLNNQCTSIWFYWPFCLLFFMILITIILAVMFGNSKKKKR